MDSRDRAARVLAAGGSQTAAADAAGVNRSTITRWVKDPDFQRLVSDGSGDEPLDETSDEITLQSLVPQAMAVLQEALSDGDVSRTTAQIALDIVKAARAEKGKNFNDGGTPPLATLLQELDDSAGTWNAGATASDD